MPPPPPTGFEIADAHWELIRRAMVHIMRNEQTPKGDPNQVFELFRRYWHLFRDRPAVRAFVQSEDPASLQAKRARVAQRLADIDEEIANLP